MRANTTQDTRASFLATVRASLPTLPTLPRGITNQIKGLTPIERSSVQAYIGMYGAIGMAHVLLGHLVKLNLSGQLPTYWLSDITDVELHKSAKITFGNFNQPVKLNIEGDKFYSTGKIFRTCKVFYIPSLTPAEFSYHGIDLINQDLTVSPLDSGERITDQSKIKFLSFSRQSRPGWTHQPYAHSLINRTFTSFDELLDQSLASDTMRFGRELLAVNRVRFGEDSRTVAPVTVAWCQQLLSYWEECSKRVIAASL